jgi:hypothetical protein
MPARYSPGSGPSGAVIMSSVMSGASCLKYLGSGSGHGPASAV